MDVANSKKGNSNDRFKSTNLAYVDVPLLYSRKRSATSAASSTLAGTSSRKASPPEPLPTQRTSRRLAKKNDKLCSRGQGSSAAPSAKKKKVYNSSSDGERTSESDADDPVSDDGSSYSDGVVSIQGRFDCLNPGCSERFSTVKRRSEHAQNTHVKEITCETSHGKKRKLVRAPDALFHCVANDCNFADHRPSKMKDHTSAHEGRMFEKNSQYPESIDEPLPPRQPYPLDPQSMKLVLAELNMVPDTDDYEWSSGGQRCAHDSRGALAEISCVDSSCAVLSYLQGMYYSPALKAIVASRHGMAELLTAKDLKQHVEHKDFPQYIRNNIQAMLPELVKHVAKAFDMDLTQSSLDLTFLNRISNTVVPRPIPYFPEPAKGIKCPKCPQWFAYKKGLTRHWGEKSICRLEDYEQEDIFQNYSLLERYSQPYGPIGAGDRSSGKIALPASWAPHGRNALSVPPLSLVPRAPYCPPCYFKEIGWWTFVSEIESGGLEFLSQFTVTPSRALIAATEKAELKNSALKTAASMERGLYEFSLKVAPQYLFDAQRLIETYHPGLRDALKIDGLKSFRLLERETLMRYRTLIVMVFGFVVRFILRKRMEGKNRVKVQTPKGFDLKMTEAQRDLFCCFLGIVGTKPPNGKYDLQALGKLTHKILVSILREEVGLERSNLSIVEQVLAIHMIDSDGCVRYTNLFTQRCAHIQRILLSSFVHAGVLAGFGNDYLLPLAEGPSVYKPDDVVEPSELEEPIDCLDPDAHPQGIQEEIDEEIANLGALDADKYAMTQALSQLSDLGGSVGEDGSDGLLDDGDDDFLSDGEDEGIFANPDTGNDFDISKFFKENIYLFQKENLTHQNPRLKKAWLLASADALQEASAVEVTWDKSGQYFHFKYRQKTKVICISDLKAAAVNSNEKLSEMLQELLPSEVQFSEFCLDDIKGYSTTMGSEKSIVDDPVNQLVFKTLIDATWDAISEPITQKTPGCISLKSAGNRWDIKQIENYLKNAQKFQDAMLVAFYSSIGVPPRPWQTTNLAYRPYDQPNANIDILRGQVIIQNPRAKQKGKKEYIAMWGLPPALGRALIFYLGIIREVEIRLLEILHTPTELHRIYIFTRLRHPKQKILNFRYSTPQLNKVLRSSELGHDPFEMRHITTAIFRQHLPDLLKPKVAGTPVVRTSVVSSQSQHEDSTGNTHYAPDEVKRLTGYSITEAEEQLCVSHALQEMYGLIPPSGEVGTSEDRRLYALHISRHQILREACGYNLVSKDSGDGWMKRSQRATELLTEKPFLFGSKGLKKGETWIDLGDDILVRVTAAVVYGGKKLDLLSLPPVGGYTEKLVSVSVGQIILAIQELGQGVLKSSDGNLALLRKVAEWEKETETLLRKYRKSNPDGWIRFCTAVHSYAKSHAAEMAPEVLAVQEVDLSGSEITFADSEVA